MFSAFGMVAKITEHSLGSEDDPGWCSPGVKAPKGYQWSILRAADALGVMKSFRLGKTFEMESSCCPNTAKRESQGPKRWEVSNSSSIFCRYSLVWALKFWYKLLRQSEINYLRKSIFLIRANKLLDLVFVYALMSVQQQGKSARLHWDFGMSFGISSNGEWGMFPLLGCFWEIVFAVR